MNNIEEKKINVAIIFDQDVESGGGFQQGLNASILAKKIDPKLAKVHFFHTKKKIKSNLIQNGIDSKLIKLFLFKRIYLFIKTTEKYRFLYKLFRPLFDFNFFEAFLLKEGIDLVYFISPSRFSLDLNQLNFIFTVWDLCHREQIEFPEIKTKGEFENRELRLNYACKRAISIIVDCEFSKLNLYQKYNIELSRIKIIPFDPLIDIKDNRYSSNSLINTIDKYKIKSVYVFYPAQFWPHKNHIYILKSLLILEKKYDIIVSAVFSGGDKGNKQFIVDYARKLGIQDRVIFTGFISNIEIISHYKSSLALVMPSFFGPTNIPPIEAFNLGTPVIYPDLPGFSDQIGAAGLLVDIYDPNSLSECLFRLITNKNLRTDLTKKGYKVFERYKNFNRIKVLNKVLEEFIIKYSTYNNNQYINF